MALHRAALQQPVWQRRSGGAEAVLPPAARPPPPPRLQVGGVRRFVDISVPRNIAPNLNELEGAIVYNVDDLKEVGGHPSPPHPLWPATLRLGMPVCSLASPGLPARVPSQALSHRRFPTPPYPRAQVVAANKEERARAAAEAEVLLAEEQLAFEAWRDSLETVPTIKVGGPGRLAGSPRGRSGADSLPLGLPLGFSRQGCRGITTRTYKMSQHQIACSAGRMANHRAALAGLR